MADAMCMALNIQQQQFVDEYLVDLNATAAATRAGYSAKTAYSQGQRLLKHVEIRAAIDSAKMKRAEKTGITAERTLREVERMAFYDVQKLFKPDGTLLSIHDMEEDARRAITGFEVVELYEGVGKNRTWIGYLKKVKLASKETAVSLAGKHLKLFNDTVDVNVNDTASKLDRVKARARKAGDR